MKNRSLFITVILLLIGVMTLSAFAVINTGNTTKKSRVTVIVDNSGDSKWNSFKEGLDQGAADHNMSINYVTTDSFTSLENERKIVEAEMDDGCDGMILQPYSSTGMNSVVTDIISRVPLVFVTSGVSADVDVDGRYSVTSVDDDALGKTLANEMKMDNGNTLEGVRIGILSGRQRTDNMKKRLEGLKATLDGTGCSIAWEYDSTFPPESKVKSSLKNSEVDIICSLDDESLALAAEAILGNDTGDEVKLYGEGSSQENLYYLRNGVIDSMIVVDGFTLGYESVSAIAQRISSRQIPMQDAETDFKMVSSDDIFDESNQRMLFPMQE